MGRVTSTTNPDGEIITHTFNTQGEIDSVIGDLELLSNIDYNALGKITEKAFGNGLSTNYTYNTDDFRLSRIETDTLQDLNYTYDDAGNISSITDDVNSKTQLFSYDDLDRLISASESAGFDYEYAYDPIGNLTSFSASESARTYTYNENGLPHALTSISSPSASFSYDDNGNLTNNDGGKCYEYNDANRLIKAYNCSDEETIAEYIYDYNGNRIIKRNFTGGILAEIVTSWSDSFETKTVAETPDQTSATWNSWDAVISTTDSEASIIDSEASISATLELWESSDNNGVDFGTELASYSAGLHYEGFNNANNIRSINSGQYPYIGKSTVARGSDTGESGAASPSGVLDLQMHPPGNEHLIVASFVAPETGQYSVSNLGARRVMGWGEETALKVFNDSETLIATVTTDSQTWTIDNNTYSLGTLNEGDRIYFAVDNVEDLIGDATEVTWTVSGLLGTSQLAPIDITWNSWDTEISPTIPGADIQDAGSSVSATLSFYESASNNDIDFGTEFASYSAGLHSGGFNNANHIRSRIDNNDQYPYIGKSTVGRGSDSGESGQSSPSDVLDLQLHPPGNEHLTVAAFNVPHDGEYTVSNLASRRVMSWGEEASLKVFDQNGDLITTVITDSRTWSHDNTTYNLGFLEQGDKIYFAADNVDDIIGDGMEVTWTVRGSISPTLLPQSTSYYFANSQLIAKKDNSGSYTYFHNDHLGSTGVVTDENGDLVEVTSYDPWG